MTLDQTTTPLNSGISRRTVAKGMAWAAPAIALASAAPAFATSPGKEPRFHGWMRGTIQSIGGTIPCRSRLSLTSAASPSMPPTPDGEPYGLYLDDIPAGAEITGGAITVWLLGDPTVHTWRSEGGHSQCWPLPPTKVGSVTKSDGLQYTGYRWEYTCAVDADGSERLRLPDFRVRGSLQQPRGDLCNDTTYWIEREITVDGETLSFERRGGTRGPVDEQGISIV